MKVSDWKATSIKWFTAQISHCIGKHFMCSNKKPACPFFFYSPGSTLCKPTPTLMLRGWLWELGDGSSRLCGGPGAGRGLSEGWSGSLSVKFSLGVNPASERVHVVHGIGSVVDFFKEVFQLLNKNALLEPLDKTKMTTNVKSLWSS